MWEVEELNLALTLSFHAETTFGIEWNPHEGSVPTGLNDNIPATPELPKTNADQHQSKHIHPPPKPHGAPQSSESEENVIMLSENRVKTEILHKNLDNTKKQGC